MGKKAKYVFNEYLIEPTILKQVKKDNNILYGSQALAKQIGVLKVNRIPSDYDIFSRHPKKSAKQLERSLDKKMGGDFFYYKPAVHRGTHKVMNKGIDMKEGTRDDYGVADFSQIPRPTPKTRIINGIRYERLSEISKSKRKALRDPKYKFRHEKDRKDLNLIKLHRKIQRRFL